MSFMDDIDEQFEKLQKHLRLSEGDQLADDLTLIVSSLVQRRIDFYPEVKRLVVDYDIVNTPGGGFHLNVVSSILNGDSESDVFDKEADKLYPAKETSLHV